MFNKKRLAMMAVAASMVLPTNFTYLSLTTPVTVFAAEATTITSDNDLTSTVETGSTLDIGYDKKYSTETIKFTGTDYKVTGNISLTKTIYIAPDSTVNIEVAKGATISIPLQYGFLIGKGATLNITGEGTIKGTTSTPTSGICEMIRLNDENAILTLGSALTFTQETKDNPFTYGIVLGNEAKGSTVTIGEEGTEAGKGTAFTLDSALSIHGAIEADDKTSITLNGATITTQDVGIYQAGYSKLNVNDCTITSTTYSGIETRTGILNVTGGTIKSEGTTLESKKSGNGTATKGAGIAIAQHTVSETNSRDLEVTIDDTTLEGTASLLISDPQGNHKEDSELASNISITVKDSTLTGDVAYTSDYIGFTLENVEPTPEVKKFTGDGEGALTADTNELNPDTIPYTIINESISEEDIKNIAGEDNTVTIGLPEDQAEDKVLKSLLSDLDLTTLFDEDNGALTPDSLVAAFTKKSEETVAEANNKAPNYEYSIRGLKGFELKSQNGGLALVPEDEEKIVISVKLKENSNIKLTTEDDQEDSGDQEDPVEESKVDDPEPFGEMIEVLSETAEAGDEAPADGGEEEPTPEEDEDVTEYVEISALTAEGDAEEKINTYLSDTEGLEEFIVDKESSKLPATLAEDETLVISGDSAEVELDDNDFITVHLTKKTDKVEGAVDLTKASSVVLKLNSDKTLDTVVVTLSSSEEGEEDKTETIPASDIGEEGKYQIVDQDGNVVDYSNLTSSTTGLSIVDNNNEENKHDITSIVIASDGGTGSGSRPSKPKPKPEQPSDEPVVGTPTTMYRLYNRLTGEHLYTIDKNERDNLLTSDTWKDEGEGWIAPSVSDYPVYRLLNPNNGDHHYTTDKNEFDTLPSYGWVAEGLAFFSADKDNPENVLLHRLYNPNAEGAGSHHYTADTNERDALVEKGWTYEGLAWAGLPDNK